MPDLTPLLPKTYTPTSEGQVEAELKRMETLGVIHKVDVPVVTK